MTSGLPTKVPLTTRSNAGFADVPTAQGLKRIEYLGITLEQAHRPLLVFLHEGLGSVSMWRDFPAALCEAIGTRGIVYSRPGYGQSTPRPEAERWGVDYMHRQAFDVLPAFLQALGIDARAGKPWLFGHSDGGSIALLYASRFPDAVAGVIAMAPHIVVEPVSITSIAAARDAYAQGELRARLARHHADVDSAFWGWNHAWLAPAFLDFDITAELPAIRCPVLAMQGVNDEYGTLEQIHGIARRVPQAQVIEIPDCAHSPHRDQPARVIAEVAAFLKRHAEAPSGAPGG